MRRRSVWEAADSGVLLWRKNFKYFIPFFAVPVLVTAAVLAFISADNRWVSFLTLWWLKPLFDRLCLQVTAVRFFSRDSENAAVFKQISNGLFGLIFRGLIGDLLWRRFSFIRSAAMPLRLLEKPKRKQYSERKNILASGGLKFCTLLTIIGPVIEAVLFFGTLIFGITMLELFYPGGVYEFNFSMIDFSLIFFTIYTINYILVESLYVCMGFGVYINSRTEVEGWDIQLLFRKFTSSISDGISSTVKALIVIISIFIFTVPLVADEPEMEPKSVFPSSFVAAEECPLDELKEILSSSDFGGTEQGWTVRLKNQKESEPEKPKEVDISPWLKTLKEALAFALRAFVVFVIAAFLIFALIRLRQLKLIGRWKQNLGGNATANPLMPEEEPEACFKKAENLFSNGNHREAWAACLGGVLKAFTNVLDIYFPPDATEYGCLEIVLSSSSPAISGSFGDLVRNWVLLAYGGKLPPQGSFEIALSFGRKILSGRAEAYHA